jgi:hypothetical protein
MLAAVATQAEEHPWLAAAGVALGALAAFGAAEVVGTGIVLVGTSYLALIGITVAENAVITAVAQAVAAFGIGYTVEEIVHKLGAAPDIAKLVQGIGANVNGWADGTIPAPTTVTIPADYATWGTTSGDEVFNKYNSSGASTGNIVIHPDGARDDTSLDPANEQTWESKTASTDAANRLTSETVRDDNGSSTKTVFDTGTEAWSSETSAFDVYQRLQSQRVVFDAGSRQVKQYDPNNTHPYNEIDIDEDATGKPTAVQMKLDGQPNTNADFSSVGQVLGSALGRALAPNNQFVQLAAGTVIGAVGQRLAQAFAASLTTNGATFDPATVFADFNVSIAGAGASAVASFLVAELGTALHLDGFGGQLFNASAGGFAGSVASQVATKMVGTASVAGVSFDAAIAQLDFGAAAANAAYGVSALFGSFLAHEFVPAQTHEGAVAGQLFGAIGSAAGISAALSGALGSVLGFIVPGLGSLIGTILGTLIGDAFGNVPHPAAVDLLDQQGTLYAATHYQVSASDGGDYSTPDQMVVPALAIINAYLGAVKGAAFDHSKQVTLGYQIHRSRRANGRRQIRGSGWRRVQGPTASMACIQKRFA